MSKLEFFHKPAYYDKPEGQDYAGKMIATNRQMLLVTFPIASMDVLMYTKPVGFGATLARYGTWFLPAMGIASMYTTGVFASTVIRGKDDKWNQVVGAVGAGAVVGKALKNGPYGVFVTVAFIGAALFKRLSVEEGWRFFPTPEETERKRVYGSIRTPSYDFTLMKDTPEKGWTTKEEEA